MNSEKSNPIELILNLMSMKWQHGWLPVHSQLELLLVMITNSTPGTSDFHSLGPKTIATQNACFPFLESGINLNHVI